ncbi:hypothetical protein COB57_04510 [Candidatus Peregrinibacteria bacterium]|nr:MAG: hypothetical protein COB57_04510 [Candidatus Peregrinibacteria bacterium]
MENTLHKIMSELLAKLEISFEKIDIEKSDQVYHINIESAADGARMIGRFGETLDALQHILSFVLYKKFEERVPVFIDVSGYKKRILDNTLELAKRKAQKIIDKQSQEEFLPPMHPFYRKQVHLLFQTDENLKDLHTESVGERNERHIKISMIPVE